MKQLLILPQGSGLTSKERERLTKAGFITLELQHPHLARLVSPEGDEVGASTMALCALRAMVGSDYDSRVGVRSKFVELLTEAMTAGSAINGSEKP